MPRPLVLAPLDSDGRDELLHRFNTSSDPETRTRFPMVLLATEHGWGTSHISRVVFRRPDTVCRVLRRFQDQGWDGVRRQHGGGPEPTLTQEAEAELARVIEDDPPLYGIDSANWTATCLASYRAQKTGISVTPETVRLALHRLGYVCKRPTWTVQHKAQEREDGVGNACG